MHEAATHPPKFGLRPDLTRPQNGDVGSTTSVHDVPPMANTPQSDQFATLISHCLQVWPAASSVQAAGIPPGSGQVVWTRMHGVATPPTVATWSVVPISSTPRVEAIPRVSTTPTAMTAAASFKDIAYLRKVRKWKAVFAPRTTLYVPTNL